MTAMSEEGYDQVDDRRGQGERQSAQDSRAPAPGLANVPLVLGIVSILLGLVAVGLFASLRPIMVWVGMPLAPLGLVLGLAGVKVASLRGRSFTYPLAGSAVGLLSTILAGFLLVVLISRGTR